jgi:hypothetical protein
MPRRPFPANGRSLLADIDNGRTESNKVFFVAMRLFLVIAALIAALAVIDELAFDGRHWNAFHPHEKCILALGSSCLGP